MSEQKAEKPGDGWRAPDFSRLRNPPKWLADLVYDYGFWVSIVPAGVLVVVLVFVIGGTIVRLIVSVFSGAPDDIYKLLLGFAGLASVPFVIWRVRIAARGNVIAQENVHANLLTKAVEQLGAMREVKESVESADAEGKVTFEPKIHTVANREVRLGAIYALEKLARDYEPLHWPIMEILCAYVRENAGPAKPVSAEILLSYKTPLGQRSDGEQEALKRYHESQAPSVDVQAALSVMGRRPAARRKAEDEWRAREIDGQDYRLDLSGAQLAVVNLRGLNFAHANFSEANLKGAYLAGVHFEHANLLGAYFEGAKLGGTHFEGANLEGAHFEGVNCSETHFEGAKLGGAHFERAVLWHVRLHDAGLHGAHFEGVSFLETQLERAFLDVAHFEGAYFTDTHLEGAYLNEVDFRGADLQSAHFKDVDFGQALLTDALLDGVDLSRVSNLDAEALADAWGDSRTLLPKGALRPENERWLKADATKSERDARKKRWRARREYWLSQALKKSPENS